MNFISALLLRFINMQNMHTHRLTYTKKFTAAGW